MKTDCCGQAQRLQAQVGDDRRELARLRALVQLLEETLLRLTVIDRAVIETKIRMIERQHGS